MANRPDKRIYEFEGFRLDAGSSMLYRNDIELLLPPKAVETLLALVERSGEIVRKSELMEIIWADSIVEESNLSQYLHLLRKTLGNAGGGKPLIETLKRRGYRFNGKVVVVFDGLLQAKSGDDLETNLTVGDSRRTSTNRHEFRVQKRGNVLALADWKEREVDQPLASDRPGPSEVGEMSKLLPTSGIRPMHIAAVSFAALVLGTLSIIWFKSISDGANLPLKRDLTILNLTSGEDVNFATISPDGNYFVYASRDGDNSYLWLQQTGQATRLEIIKPFPGSIHGTTFTPDSKFVYFLAAENQDSRIALYRVPALGGVRSKILDSINSPVSFSPDGREMVFIRRNWETNQSSLVVASEDGTQERTVLTRVGEESIDGSAAWSADGGSIAFGAVKSTNREGSCTILGIAPKGGQTRELSPERWDNCFRIAWTHDGQGLVLIGTKNKEAFSTQRDQIYYVSISDGESRRLTTDGSRHQDESLGVTDKDEILAVPFNRLSQIWAMNAGGDSRTAVQITSGFADGRGGIAPLADSRVAYLTRNGDGFSVWLMNADGSERKQITADPSEIEELRSDPNGRFFVFSAKKDGWAHLFRFDAAGGNLSQLTFGESQEIDSSVSPDGNWIVYGSKVFNGNYGRSVLWKVFSDGGKPVHLADIDCTTPHFSFDGKFVSCILDGWRQVAIVSTENGALIRTLQTIENRILNVGSRWTPDGTSLTYIVANKNAGNIWLHPTNGGKPHPLTDFTSGDIYNYAFSIDGSRLYVAHGYQVRKAVLISSFR